MRLRQVVQELQIGGTRILSVHKRRSRAFPDKGHAMPLIRAIAENWQQSLPLVAAAVALSWFTLFRHDPASEQAIFAALFVIYALHQIEEHLWPGGFRQFTN